jgi:hypothetical protein
MSKPDSDRSLKSLNMKWLVLLVSLDVVIVLLFVAPEFIEGASWSTVAVMRGLVTALLPVIVLLLTGMLSHEVKARLVYWKWANPYPGCEAFSRHGPADARIDMVALKKNVGDLPSDAAEQNKKWFKLYKLVDDDKAVVEAHKLYLMYRDMATMSLLLVVLVPLGLWLGGAPPSTLWITALMFAIQFVVCCLGARNSGTRFVCNVLSIHSTKKIPQTAKAAPTV